MNELQEIAENVIAGNDKRVRELTQVAIDKGAQASEILEKGLLAGMNVVGQRFKEADMFIPEVILSARAMDAGIDVLRPLLMEGGNFQSLGCIVLGTVKGDIHEIGKNLVGILLRSVGFEVVDLGINVSPQTFIEKALEKNARLIAMSALLTVTMPAMKDIIVELKRQGLEAKIRTLVGGAVVNQKYADEIGADGYAPDAAGAVECAKSLMKSGGR